MDADKKRVKTIFYYLYQQAQKEKYVDLGKSLTIFNAGTKCDMYKGPCSCGAWHLPGEQEKKFRWVYG